MMPKWFWLASLLLLAACAAEAPQPAEPLPTATPAALPTATPVPPTPAPLPTPVISAPATPTPAAEPTAPPAEPTETADAAPTEAGVTLPEGLIGPPFPDNVNPLTGETVVDPAVLQRRPVAIKISNYPPVVRPQAGLNNADLAFEHYAEGGVTRFTAVFYGQDAEPVGSIRSGRLIDLEIPKMYDAAFAYSGASGPVRLLFRDSPFFDRIISPDFGHDGFYRVELPDRAFEHTLFTDTYFLRNILDGRGVNTPPQLQNGMVFSAEPPTGAAAVNEIEVRYIGTNAFWSYNATTGRYARYTDGVAMIDPNTQTPLTFKNVVVVAANHVDTLIVEDSLGNYSIEIQLWGEGPATIFRDGQRYDGRWQRLDPLHMIAFDDGNGQPLPLAVGNTFFQLVPLGFEGLVTR